MRTALQRSFCTWCTWKRNCFQAHTPATSLGRHSFPRGPLLVPARGGEMCSGVSCLAEVLWARAQRSLHGGRCGCSVRPRRRSPCDNKIARVSGHPREKVTRVSKAKKKKSNRNAVAPRTRNSEVGQSQQNPTSPEAHTQNLRS